MSSVVQHGSSKREKEKASITEEGSRMPQPPDLQQVTVLSKSEWRRIQDELNQVNRDKERMRETAKQREALHLQSQEVVKLWPNTISGQRQIKLEAKKIREEMEEEKRKVTDQEEAQYQEQQRKEANEKARSQLFYQTDRRALLVTEVLTEREAQIELKERIKKASKDVDNELLDRMKTREDEASRREEEKALQKKLRAQALAEDLQKQVEESERVRERQKRENQKDGEETQRLQQLHQLEQRMEEERQAEMKRYMLHAHMEHVTNKALIEATDAQKQEAEEEHRKLFLSAKQKMMKLRKEKETELFRDAQRQRETVTRKLADTQQGRTGREERSIKKAAAEQEEREAQRQWEEEEKKAAGLESIVAHRELLAEKSARHQQLRREQREFEEKNAELIAEDEHQFQQYAHHVIGEATEARRNVFPLCKAAAEGIGGGRGPVSRGVRPTYLVQDLSDAQLPTYVSGATQNIKQLNEADDILEAKRRLGFTWS
ncbi:Coiled-coil domain-containing protein 173 [Liparis tanakae]|uniref:Coiled-coil domain-containing protein 173 n=1 Tax=Liparis tanakae TaxID=230148 RepID=A0A4Z2HHU9_9TELE|nr:Coiled-coil domain-containing protein 173 [Liparis tanakae]